MAEDGSVVLVGHTSGNWAGENSGKHDFAATKVDRDGVELWRWQVSRAALRGHVAFLPEWRNNQKIFTSLYKYA